MIRITEQQAQDIWALAIDIKAIYDQKRAAGEVTGDLPLAIARAQEVADTIKGQLNAPGHEGNLVDTVAKILNDIPHGGTLGGIKLGLLRGAILTPAELVKVNEAKPTITCSTCGIELTTGSLMTQYNGTIRCLSCHAPESIQFSCPTGLDGHVKTVVLPDLVKKRIRLLMKKTDCPTCAAPAVPTEIPAAPPPQPVWRNIVAAPDPGPEPDTRYNQITRRYERVPRPLFTGPPPQTARTRVPTPEPYRPPPDYLRGLIAQEFTYLRNAQGEIEQIEVRPLGPAAGAVRGEDEVL